MTDDTPNASAALAGSIEGGASADNAPAASTEARTEAPARRRTMRDELEDMDRAADKSEQAREAGKASGEARREASAQKTGAPGDTKTVEPAAPQPGVPQPAAPLSPPDRWPAARKDLFAKQPPEVQEAWLAQGKEFEAGFTRKSQELSEKARVADAVTSAFTPEHRQDMQRAGIVDEAGAMKYLLAQHDFYKRDPVRYVAQIMQSAGIDPRMFLQGGAGSPQQNGQQLPAVHPGLLKEIGTLRETISHLSAREQERVTQQLDSTIDAFETAKSADGQPLHPHFARVGDAMIEIIRSDPRLRGMPDGEAKLQRAYDLAVFDDATLRQEIIDAEYQRRVSATQQAQPAPVHRAPTSIKPAAGSPDASRGQKRMTMRDVLEATDRKFGM
jgi:hypothetical protein